MAGFEEFEPFPVHPPLDHLLMHDEEDLLPFELYEVIHNDCNPVAAMAAPPENQAAWDRGHPQFLDAILACFPDISHEHTLELGHKFGWDVERVVVHILDEQEQGRQYPKQPKPSKRKRESEDENEDPEARLRKRFGAIEPPSENYFIDYISAGKMLLRNSFPNLYAQDIDNLFKANNYKFYVTYLALDKKSRGEDSVAPLRQKKFPPRNTPSIDSLPRSNREGERDAYAEYEAVKAVVEAKAAKRAEEKRKAQEEEENFQRAKAEGTVLECQCCFGEYAQNRMFHCNGDVFHWFCKDCGRAMAETAIGLQKYELKCVSTDGCEGTFSKDQKDLFLDEKLVLALDRIEQEAVLRMANIENLEKCPFCPYAAECVPVQEDKEFRCENPDCGIVSCRLCKEETHIPKTCEEVAREKGLSARRKIEEAMSAALIRKCNKCGTPFIKEAGCNKMTCSRCGNVQCYVCSKSCDYSHFDDRTRGGKPGNCPLFDSVEERHENEVQAAEERARKQLVEENPGVNEELLRFNFSTKVKEDDRRRKAANPGPPPPGRRAAAVPPPRPQQPRRDPNRHQQVFPPQPQPVQVAAPQASNAPARAPQHVAAPQQAATAQHGVALPPFGAVWPGNHDRVRPVGCLAFFQGGVPAQFNGLPGNVPFVPAHPVAFIQQPLNGQGVVANFIGFPIANHQPPNGLPVLPPPPVVPFPVLPPPGFPARPVNPVPEQNQQGYNIPAARPGAAPTQQVFQPRQNPNLNQPVAHPRVAQLGANNQHLYVQALHAAAAGLQQDANEAVSQAARLAQAPAQPSQQVPAANVNQNLKNAPRPAALPAKPAQPILYQNSRDAAAASQRLASQHARVATSPAVRQARSAQAPAGQSGVKVARSAAASAGAPQAQAGQSGARTARLVATPSPHLHQPGERQSHSQSILQHVAAALSPVPPLPRTPQQGPGQTENSDNHGSAAKEGSSSSSSKPMVIDLTGDEEDDDDKRAHRASAPSTFQSQSGIA